MSIPPTGLALYLPPGDSPDISADPHAHRKRFGAITIVVQPQQLCFAPGAQHATALDEKVGSTRMLRFVWPAAAASKLFAGTAPNTCRYTI